MKHVDEFNSFLSDHVDLSESRRDLLNRRVKAVYECLSRTLDSYEKHERQGSYALDTIVRPVDGQEYDADILLFMQHRRGKEPKSYIDDVHDALRNDKNYANKIQRKTRSVVVNYSGDFHLDVVPCIGRGGQSQVCNYKENKFEPTDGTGYREWFNCKTDVTNGHLKAVTRLLKYLRNHKGNFEVPSVLLTTLIGHAVHLNERGKRFRDVPETLKVISNRINSFLQATPPMPRLRNPALRSERFTRHWNQDRYLHCRKMLCIYNEHMNAAFDETNALKSIQKWRVLFGDNFG